MFFLSLAFDILVQPVVECNQWGSAGMPGAVPEGFLKREALIFSLFNSCVFQAQLEFSQGFRVFGVYWTKRTTCPIMRDMEHKESYIDKSIETPGRLPTNVLGILRMLSECDEKGQDVLYYDRLNDLWVICKNAMAAGAMSKKDWETIKEKYWVHADIISAKEEKDENTSS